MISRKKSEKSGTVINTCMKYLKYLKKVAEIPQERDFFHLEHLKFCKDSETVC